MRFINIKWIFFFLLMAASLSADSKNSKFGVITEGLEFANSKDAKIAIQVWLNEIATEEENYAHKIVMGFYDDQKNAIKDFINQKIEYLTLNTFIYLQEKEKLEPYTKSKYAFFTTSDTCMRYILVSRKDSSVNGLKDLRKKVLGMNRSEYMETLYIDDLLLKGGLSSYKSFFNDIKKYKKDSTVLLKLFFNKIDACVIPEHTWNFMIEMNPQIARKLKVLNKSKKIFLPTLSLIGNNMDSRLYKIHHDKSMALADTSKGKNIVRLLKIDRYKYIDEEMIQPMISFYQQYKTLKERVYGN